MEKTKVFIIAGSQSDVPKISDAEKILDEMKIKYKTAIISAHRAPDYLYEYVKAAEKNGAKVFVAAAGMAAHLPGVIASHTCLPVIGVPISASLGGMDALLSTVQMPKEVPVAAVAIDNSANAALLAARILAVHDEKLRKKLVERRKNIEHKIKTLNKDNL